MTDYVFDTDSFIFLLKNRPVISARVLQVGMQFLAVSAVTAAEVLFGAYHSANPAQSLQLTRSLLGQFMLIPLDVVIADRFGQIKADLRRQGLLIPDFDLLIGATALVTQRVLVTNNTKHFQRLSAYGLQLDNWVV